MVTCHLLYAKVVLLEEDGVSERPAAVAARLQLVPNALNVLSAQSLRLPVVATKLPVVVALDGVPTPATGRHLLPMLAAMYHRLVVEMRHPPARVKASESRDLPHRRRLQEASTCLASGVVSSRWSLKW